MENINNPSIKEIDKNWKRFCNLDIEISNTEKTIPQKALNLFEGKKTEENGSNLEQQQQY